ncbi:MAG TPA: hypothetical protein PLX77_05360 [Candidatus Cloacimonadota bacterium]|nr:hypothetical protein [Candidatus Cloacimonadota bacterium]
MKMYRVVYLLFVCVLLSGCIYLDTAAQDTAIPIYPKKIDGAMYISTGMDLADTVEHTDDEEIDGAGVVNYKVGFGVHEKADVIFSMAQTDGHGSSSYSENSYESKQFEMGIKYLLKQEGKSYFSILPSLYRLRGTYWDTSHTNLRDDEYNVTGVETQALYTYRTNNNICVTVIGRAAMNSIQM